MGRNIGKGWVGLVGGHGAIVSPASSGGQEDDHSQRLYVTQAQLGLLYVSVADPRLDHWLSANASMAVGSLTGPALDTNAFTPLPNPIQFDQTLMNPTLTSPFPNQQQQQWDMNTNVNMNMTPGVNLSMDWSQPNTNTNMQIQGQFGTVGDGLPGLPEAGQENSDEYWNALIDGESMV